MKLLAVRKIKLWHAGLGGMENKKRENKEPITILLEKFLLYLSSVLLLAQMINP
jgi:hypothetical protein